MTDKTIKTSLPIVSPEYNSLKNALKEFLTQQEEFTDYVFDGSALSILLGVLAQNSHYNAFYLNQVANEAFLSTAIKPSSIALKAQDLGYTPTTIRSAVASIQLEILPTDNTFPVSYILDNPTFTARIENRQFTFYGDSLEIFFENGRYLSNEIKIYEGRKFLITSTLTALNLTNGITIPNLNVDSTSIKILVNDDGSSTYYPYVESDNIVTNNSDDRIYYINQDENGLLNIKFGDDILSKSPPSGSPFIIEYVISSGSLANNIIAFKLETPLANTEVKINVINKAIGGAFAESMDSIKKNAPLFRTTQNRAVIANDYKILLKKHFNYIEDVLAFGGEELDPPKYGKVIIAVKPSDSLTLTSLDISEISTYLSTKMPTGLLPSIIEPDYIFVNVYSTINYNKLISNVGSQQLKQTITASILEFEEIYLDSFNSDLRYSQLVRYIDFSDKSVISNNTIMTLEKKIYPELNWITLINFSFNNQIKNVVSSSFTYNNKPNCFIKDLNGTLVIYYYFNNVLTILSEIGTVDYSTGEIDIPSIIFQSLSTPTNVDPVTDEIYFSLLAETINTDLIATNNIIYQFNRVEVDLKEVKNSR